MKKKMEVIFLIDSESYDMNLLGISLEKYTKCRVFNFFSFEETLLYKNLNPKVIVHDNGIVDIHSYNKEVRFCDISTIRAIRPNLNQTDTVLALANQVSSLVN
ncbi:MAG TPA: hypothetical protein PKL31_04525 [Fulvivirga sp.]|nr:hypothetical protein [Fulvivirga sp.]